LVFLIPLWEKAKMLLYIYKPPPSLPYIYKKTKKTTITPSGCKDPYV
jgi:hypothetical protein